MKAKPMGMLLMMLAGWINRHQQDVITYLREGNKVLREKLGTSPLSAPSFPVPLKSAASGRIGLGPAYVLFLGVPVTVAIVTIMVTSWPQRPRSPQGEASGPCGWDFS